MGVAVDAAFGHVFGSAFTCKVGKWTFQEHLTSPTPSMKLVREQSTNFFALCRCDAVLMPCQQLGFSSSVGVLSECVVFLNSTRYHHRRRVQLFPTSSSSKPRSISRLSFSLPAVSRPFFFMEKRQALIRLSLLSLDLAGPRDGLLVMLS